MKGTSKEWQDHDAILRNSGADKYAIEQENAHLRIINADLLNALQWALTRIETSGLGVGEHWAKARAVIARAKE